MTFCFIRKESLSVYQTFPYCAMNNLYFDLKLKTTSPRLPCKLIDYNDVNKEIELIQSDNYAENSVNYISNT